MLTAVSVQKSRFLHAPRFIKLAKAGIRCAINELVRRGTEPPFAVAANASAENVRIPSDFLSATKQISSKRMKWMAPAPPASNAP